MTEDLWIEGQTDALDPQPARRRPRPAAESRHIGCPLAWFTWVFPVVSGKNELAVALYLYRLRVIQHSRKVKVSNTRLLDELGIDRYAKYRALRRLAGAGIITVNRRRPGSLEVIFHSAGGRNEMSEAPRQTGCAAGEKL
jgi:hypothetical protein